MFPKLARMGDLPVTMSLEDQSINLRRRIAELEDQLRDVEARLHRKRVRESGLLGHRARSDRVPMGVVIDNVTFKTWAPSEPQSVSGHRLGGSGAYTTIHVNSPGYHYDADETCLRP